jgi:HD-GYP domain-containing protein (c-di-GMP phosphodiesterase class II)
MNQNLSKEVVQSFAGALKGLQLYPLNHPGCEQRFRRLHDQILAFLSIEKELRIGLMEEALLLNDHLFTSNPGADTIVSALKGSEIEGLEIQNGLEYEEVVVLIKLLMEKRGQDELFEDALNAEGVKHIIPLSAEEESPREVYGRALQVVETIFRDARMGKVPSSREAVEVVRSMVRISLNAPHTLLALTLLKDYDNYTFTHSVNVSVIAMAVGRACGLPPTKMRVLGLGAMLHDLGKLKIDIDIINKPGKLTTEEFAQIMLHPASGAALVAQMQGISTEVLDIVLGHHLRYDRQGYPADARGREISPMADMAAIGDAYDAMTTLRSYQRPVTPRKAIESLREMAGSSLHPVFLENFIAFLGPYPVGSLVRLDSGEVALVVWMDVNATDNVRLRILFDKRGERLGDSVQIELRGAEMRRIVTEIDPAAKGIEVTDYLEYLTAEPPKG